MACTLTSVVTHGSHLHHSQDPGKQEEGGVNVEELTVQLLGTTSIFTAQMYTHTHTHTGLDAKDVQYFCLKCPAETLGDNIFYEQTHTNRLFVRCSGLSITG